MTYQSFLKLLIDKFHVAKYFNQRVAEKDDVVRKIDRLSPQLEHAICELVSLQIRLTGDAEYFR
jgi:hypothetical protein